MNQIFSFAKYTQDLANNKGYIIVFRVCLFHTIRTEKNLITYSGNPEKIADALDIRSDIIACSKLCASGSHLIPTQKKIHPWCYAFPINMNECIYFSMKRNKKKWVLLNCMKINSMNEEFLIT